MGEGVETRGWTLASEYLPTIHPPTSNDEIDQRCILCFESLTNESYLTLKCSHAFHLCCWCKVVDKSKCCLCTLATDTSAAQVNAGIIVHAADSFTAQVNPGSFTAQVNPGITFHTVNLDLFSSLFPFSHLPQLTSMDMSRTGLALNFDEENKRAEEESDAEEEFFQFHARRTNLRKISKMMKQLRTKMNVQRRQNVSLLSMMQSELLKLSD